jgi:hypothetical protein
MSFIGGFTTQTRLASTVPAVNGDLNPYGIVTVPRSVGSLQQGDLLVSNFNNSVPPAGQQGTGTTIVQIPPSDRNLTPGSAPLFAQIDASKLPGRSWTEERWCESSCSRFRESDRSCSTRT